MVFVDFASAVVVVLVVFIMICPIFASVCDTFFFFVFFAAFCTLLFFMPISDTFFSFRFLLSVKVCFV